MELVIALLVGLGVGGAAAWIHFRHRLGSEVLLARTGAEAERATAQERLAAARAEAERLAERLVALERIEHAGREALRAEAERRATAEQLAARIPQLEQELAASRSALREYECACAGHQSESARLRAELASEKTMLGEKMALLADARKQLESAFQALSAQALQANNQSFLDLAAQALGRFQQGAQGELEKRQQAIQELVVPVRQSLEKLDGRIHEIEKTREGAYQALTSQVRALAEGQSELRRETGNLVKALRQPAARGRWGELQLKRVVEMAGMLDHCDFVEQVSVEGEEGRLRPDVIVRLPGGRNIVVDAKTPLSAYLEAVETQDDGARKQFLVDHARQVRDHMTKLGRKSYQDQFDSTPELVILFLPGEMFFSAALEQDPELIEFGVGEKVLPATPTTLIAMLRAIAYGWKQEALARNAQEISDLGRELHERVAVMAGHWSKVGRNLHEAVGAYNKAVASLETRVLVSTRKFKELKVVPDGREIPELEPVDLVPRAMQAPELAGPVITPLEAANAGD